MREPSAEMGASAIMGRDEYNIKGILLFSRTIYNFLAICEWKCDNANDNNEDVHLHRTRERLPAMEWCPGWRGTI